MRAERPSVPIRDASIVVDEIVKTDATNLAWVELSGFRAHHGMPSYEGFLQFLDDSQVEAHRVSNGWLLKKASWQGGTRTEIYRVFGDKWVRTADPQGYTIRKTMVGPWTDT